MTEYKLNVYLEWTYEDRAKGESPVPEGADVTVWLSSGRAGRGCDPEEWNWGQCSGLITAYLIHSVPREPIVRWMVVGGGYDGNVFKDKGRATERAENYNGRVVKLVEEME